MCAENDPIRVMALAGPMGEVESRPRRKAGNSESAGSFWQAFSADGVDVAIATDLEECLGRLGRFEYDAVVLDLRAAGRSLVELSRLKRSCQQRPIFVLVDATDGSVGHWVVHHGATACLDVKYFNAESTRTMIQQAVRKRREIA